MRRAVIAVAGLAAGTTLMVVVKGAAGAAQEPTLAAEAPQDGLAPATGGPTPPAQPTPGAAAPSATPAAAPSSKAPKKSPTRKATTDPEEDEEAPPPPPPTSNTVTGPRVSNPYGGVQVEITLGSGNRITDIRAIEMPDSEARSSQLSDIAEPQLREEALREQGANLDTVSGATQTCESYEQSLRAAIEAARRGERD